MSTLQGLSVLVTGGSRGLGLLVARECARRGCAVTIAARDEAELERAVAAAARPGGGGVTGHVCDVRDREAVRDLVARTARERGGPDVVLANAGIIQVAPADAVGTEGFRDAMETMFFGALHTALESLPYLRRSPAGGRLGLIGSVGGLVPVPHLVPYSCAKSAVAALAEGLHAEEREKNVSVTAIHPGLMRTGSHVQAEFGGAADREYAWFSTLAGLPLLTMDAERAAVRVVAALEKRRTRVVLTPAAKLGDKVHDLAPVLVTRVNAAVARLLPDAPPGARTTGGGTVKGLRLARSGSDGRGGTGGGRSRWQAALSALNDRASRRFNELGQPAPREH